MTTYAFPDDQAPVPLQCPISTTLLAQLPSAVRVLFSLINDARLSGSLRDLEFAQELASSGLDLGDTDEGLNWGLALKAAVGDCLTISGRWSGDEQKSQEGVRLIQEFVHAIDKIERSKKPLNDDGATRIRAHAYLGNAVTRLAYISHLEEHLQEAVRQLEGLRGQRPKNEPFPLVVAGIHRDLGDAYIGQLHWSKTIAINAGIYETLEAAASMFSEQLASTRHKMAFEEWAATMSSLAVAKAKIAELIANPEPRIEDSGEHREVSLEGLIARRQKKGLVDELLDAAEETCWRVWRIYLGLLSQPAAKLSFRWARTISNLGFAGSYIYVCDRSRIATAGLAEAAFLSLLNKGKFADFRRAAVAPADMRLYDGCMDHAVAYHVDDHPGRYTVNKKGLKSLYEVMRGRGSDGEESNEN